MPESFYLQYMPDERAQNWLCELQTKYATTNSSERLTSPKAMHLTILHFGHLSDTLAQLQTVHSDLSAEMFYEGVAKLIRASDPLLPSQLELHATGIDLFGPHGTALAVTFKPTTELVKIHSSVHEKLGDFLEHIGIQQNAVLPHRKRALQIHPTIKPHITLIKGVQPQQHVLPERFNSAPQLRLVRNPGFITA
ncbi:MAG TPA: hypothetical protein VK983_03035 [Candidatus Limnocylindrales bacterium]|nr:hypothetical protein [Candidatus Limnocylindrales bacterium]